MKKEEKIFKAETKELLNLMIHSIYTNKEIFLRELISNANDAIDKLKFKSLTDTDILKGDNKFKIEISVDKDNRTLTITDNGIGMTYEEVDDNIGTIAKSGSKLFKEQLEEAKKGDIDIIGQFGVGFYSGFIVADKITLETKSPYSENGVKWISSGDGNYEIEEISKEDVCASFQRAVFDVLIFKTEKLMKEKKLDTLVVSGGVSANNTLREEINKMCEKNGFKSYFPDKILCTDNAAMIASSGYYEYISGVRSDLTLNVEPNLELEN